MTFNFKNDNGKFTLVASEVTDHKRDGFSGLVNYAPNAGNKGILVLNSSSIKGMHF